MPKDVLKPCVVSIAWWRRTILPAGVFPQALAAPVRSVERRICHRKIEALVLQLVLVEAAFVVPSDIGIDATDGEIHLAKAPCRVIALLPVDGDIVETAAMRLHKFFCLHEHATR